MKKIGLTGGIGSGKSTVAKVFSALGVPVYDSDKEAKQIINTDKIVKRSLISSFGNETYIDEVYNRKHISQIVFKNKEKLNVLNKIVHPAVKYHFGKWCEKQQQKGVSYVIKEAAILFESGAHLDLDKVITVNAPERLRIDRVVKRDKVSAAEVISRIEYQITDKIRVELSDYQVENSGIYLVVPQLLILNKKINSLV